MSTTHSHPTARHAESQRQDPTGTKTLRRQYASQFFKRYRRVKGLVWEGVAEQNRLALAAQQDDDPERPEPEPAPGGTLPPEIEQVIRDELNPSPTPTQNDVIKQFIEWFRKVQDDVVVGPDAPGEGNWSDKYLRYAYDKGASDAMRRAVEEGIAESDALDGGMSRRSGVGVSFNLPIHQRTLGLLFEKNRTGLDGITDATRREVGRELADALLGGENPREVARRINDRVDAIGITRARTHARTTIISAYNESALARYEQLMGADGEVTVLAEFTTAGDSRVCPICRALEGNIYSVREAKTLIPVHPNCRCTWIPHTRQVDPAPERDAL